jgi:SnoaL-like domain
MSEENVELFEKALDGYNGRDIGPVLETSDPEAEWYPFTAQVEGDEAYHGHEGIREWWANVDAAFEEFEASVEEVRDLGDAVLALSHLRARFKSGVTLDTGTSTISTPSLPSLTAEEVSDMQALRG